MLTSYPTLFGGLAAAVLCSTGMVSQKDAIGVLAAVNESSQIPSAEIPYRGSGRLDGQSENGDRAQGAQGKSSLIAHRGSGRIQPRIQP